MAEQKYVLINADETLVAEGIAASGSRAGDAASQWQVRLRTCHGGVSEGVQVIEIDNGHMRIDVLPTRGMGIWRIVRGGRALGWQSPAQRPVHPAFVQLMEPAGLGWLDGFNELLCRCGLESNGPPEFDSQGRLLRPLHGRIANTPAHHVELIVDEQSETLTLRGMVTEARFHFQSLLLSTTITTKLGSNEVTWTDEVINVGGRDALMQMLYHFNIGQPLLKAGRKVTAAIASVAPLTKVAAKEGVDSWNVMPPPRPDSAEQVYCLDLLADANGDSQVLVSELTRDEAVRLKFTKQSLPCFTVWRNTLSEKDGYVLGIEPGTNYPNPRSFEQSQGRVATLKPGETWKATVAAAWHDDANAIAKEDEAIRALQKQRTLELFNAPRNDWSASP